MKDGLRQPGERTWPRPVGDQLIMDLNRQINTRRIRPSSEKRAVIAVAATTMSSTE